MTAFRLYFFYRPACGWCEKARPIVDKVARERASLVIPINMERQKDGTRGFVPDGTPAYLLVVGNVDRAGDIGFKSEKNLNKWLDEALLADDDDDEDAPTGQPGEGEDEEEE